VIQEALAGRSAWLKVVNKRSEGNPRVSVAALALLASAAALSGCHSAIHIPHPPPYKPPNQGTVIPAVEAPTASGLPNPAANAPAVTPATPRLLLYGGEGNKVYLGSPTDSPYSPDSIFNRYGIYGNPQNVASIWNPYGIYGSSYSDYSPWNPDAADPPIIVDANGAFYGYFTENRAHPNVTRVEVLAELLANHR
jgi:hypothetical protein